MSIGLSFPFAVATGSLGYLAVTNDVVSAIQSNARSLLLTNWGERVMHYNFGCNLRQYLFEPQTQQTRSAIASRIKSQFQKWMPFLSLDALYVSFGSEESELDDTSLKVRLEMSYGNIPIKLFQIFPS